MSNVLPDHSINEHFNIEVLDYEVVKAHACWGTFGFDGKGPLRWVKLVDCDTEHLQNILKTQPQIPSHYLMAIKDILKERKNHADGPSRILETSR